MQTFFSTSCVAYQNWSEFRANHNCVLGDGVSQASTHILAELTIGRENDAVELTFPPQTGGAIDRSIAETWRQVRISLHLQTKEMVDFDKSNRCKDIAFSYLIATVMTNASFLPHVVDLGGALAPCGPVNNATRKSL